MIKILKAPLQLEPFLDEFKDLFTKPSYRSFRDLCATLSVCVNDSFSLSFQYGTAILLWKMDNPPSKENSKSRTMGEMIDRVKMQAAGETFEYIITYFNLSVPDGGLLCILKSLGLKI